ncbi:hypothetical protein SISNIDRAFT_463818 [Sistotremastrum niveocremeum HHB9708]|uniref:Uncharacterized protein n=1 Tax=Sistotremastrum niveocremeum HHB9708 TaxID=1314777 RepID=A0A164XUZ3_9AGAM|nr:hypothetical protein SISNIDRAFT_463818 [Sistotremastrum niveocremeum HHB9708]
MSLALNLTTAYLAVSTMPDLAIHTTCQAVNDADVRKQSDRRHTGAAIRRRSIEQTAIELRPRMLCLSAPSFKKSQLIFTSTSSITALLSINSNEILPSSRKNRCQNSSDLHAGQASCRPGTGSLYGRRGIEQSYRDVKGAKYSPGDRPDHRVVYTDCCALYPHSGLLNQPDAIFFPQGTS